MFYCRSFQEEEVPAEHESHMALGPGQWSGVETGEGIKVLMFFP